jgi:UDP-glucose 4-epimerase
VSRSRNLLVTGAAGFVGRRLVPAAAARRWDVSVLEKDHPAAESVDGVTGLRLVHDVRKTVFPTMIAPYDAIVHLAAFIPPDLDDARYAADCLAVNALGTLNVLESVGYLMGTHVVVLGAANAYLPRRRPAREDDAMLPIGRAPFYLASKVVADGFVEHYRRYRGIQATSVRATSIYGPGMPERSAIVQFLSRLGRGKPVEVADGGRYSTDLLYVDDVVEAILTVLDRRLLGPVNVGGGKRHTSLAVARSAAAALGASLDLIRVLPPTAGRRKASFPAVSIDRARSELGFVPTTLAVGLRRMLAEDPRVARPVGSSVHPPA